MTKKTALITGVTGQDGSYLAEFLLEKGYEVHGIKRRSSLFNTGRVDHIYQDLHDADLRFQMHFGDLTDTSNLVRIIQEVQPDEIYNLGAQSHVAVSFETPEYTADVDALGTLRLLEAIRLLGLEKKTKFYQASTSELYGLVQEPVQSETTPFYPRSPYDALRDWGHAKDYVRMQWMMLQQDTPDDYVIATGKQYSVRRFVEASAAHIGVTLRWEGTGLDEVGIVEAVDPSHALTRCPAIKEGQTIVRVDARYFRPTEVETLLGDPSKAKAQLGWEPEITFEALVEEMMEADLLAARKAVLLKNADWS